MKIFTFSLAFIFIFFHSIINGQMIFFLYPDDGEESRYYMFPDQA